jgi:hypothetical protein
MNNIKLKYCFLFALFIILVSFKNYNVNKESNKKVESKQNYSKIDTSTSPLTIKHSYKFGSDLSKHWERTINLPTSGKFVQEAHYVTLKDTFKNGRLFADTIDENINLHLNRSFKIYQSFDSIIQFDELYNNKWKKRWTPAERGKIGQGSVGDIQKKELTPELELWMMNMMWAKGERPKRGTRFLLTYNNRKVVVISGYETGPGQEKYLGGVTCEVHAWLGTNGNSEIKIEYLNNQNNPVGPIK